MKSLMRFKRIGMVYTPESGFAGIREIMKHENKKAMKKNK